MIVISKLVLNQNLNKNNKKGKKMDLRNLVENVCEGKNDVGCIIKIRRNREKREIGTLEELISCFSYTLEVGSEYEKDPAGGGRGKKINKKPKSFKALAQALNNSLLNSGNTGSFDYDEPTPEELEEYASGN